MLVENMKKELVAPYGMNCRICIAFFGYTMSGKKRKMNCIGCKQLEKIDSKYRKRFGMSTIDNLRFIEENGMEKFLQQQEEKYKCTKCVGIICVHNGKCYSCNSIT